MLKEDLKKNQNFDLVSVAQKGLVEMFQEINKKELSEDIETTIILLEHFESTSSFRLVNLPLNKFSKDVTAKFDEIKLQLASIVEGK